MTRPLATVTLGDVQAFSDSLTGKPSSRARTLAAVKSLLAFGQRTSYLALNVGAALKLPAGKNTLAGWLLTEPEVLRLLALECPVFAEAVHYKDVIEADRQADGSLLFRRVVEPSGFRAWTWVLSNDLVDSPLIAEICRAVQEQGGHWQRDFGGLLQMALPPGAALDPDRRFDELKAAAMATQSQMPAGEDRDSGAQPP